MVITKFPSRVFRAGSIFLGGNTAKGVWQIDIADFMGCTNANLIDTSRQDWNIVPPTPEDVKDHVEWEMDWLNKAPMTFICITSDTKSPTVLLELGIAISRQSPRYRTVVYIHPDYSHFTNAKTACDAAGVPVYTSFIDAAKRLKDLFLTSAEF